jgi:hypothetical protein
MKYQQTHQIRQTFKLLPFDGRVEVRHYGFQFLPQFRQDARVTYQMVRQDSKYLCCCLTSRTDKDVTFIRQTF